MKAEAFNEILGSRFRCLKDEVADLEEGESALVAAQDESSRKICGVIKKKKFKWLTSDVTAAAIRKVELYGKWIGTRRPQGDGAERRSEAYLEYKKANRACIKATRLAKRQQLEQKAKELKQSARCNNTRRVF